MAHISASTPTEKATMAMRFHGSMAPANTSTPPDIQDGFATSTFCEPNRVRAAWISIRLMPQVASSVSSGRP